MSGSAALRYQPGGKAFKRDESVHVQHARTSLTMPMPSCPITSAASGQGQLLTGTAVPALAPTDFLVWLRHRPPTSLLHAREGSNVQVQVTAADTYAESRDKQHRLSHRLKRL